MKKKKTQESTNQGSKAVLMVKPFPIGGKTSLNATMKQAEKILASKLKSIIH